MNFWLKNLPSLAKHAAREWVEVNAEDHCYIRPSGSRVVVVGFSLQSVGASPCTVCFEDALGKSLMGEPIALLNSGDMFEEEWCPHGVFVSDGLRINVDGDEARVRGWVTFLLV